MESTEQLLATEHSLISARKQIQLVSTSQVQVRTVQVFNNTIATALLISSSGIHTGVNTANLRAVHTTHVHGPQTRVVCTRL